MRPLTIEQLKALQVGDWVWIADADGDLGSYARKCVRFDENEFQYETIEMYEAYNYADYGKTWCAYKNKEQAEAKGEIVELPKAKWVITRGAVCVVGNFDYAIEEHVPVARWMIGRWHFGYEPIDKWRVIVEEFNTKEQAEARLAELKGEKL